MDACLIHKAFGLMMTCEFTYKAGFKRRKLRKKWGEWWCVDNHKMLVVTCYPQGGGDRKEWMALFIKLTVFQVTWQHLKNPKSRIQIIITLPFSQFQWSHLFQGINLIFSVLALYFYTLNNPVFTSCPIPTQHFLIDKNKIKLKKSYSYVMFWVIRDPCKIISFHWKWAQQILKIKMQETPQWGGNLSLHKGSF